MDDLTDDVMYDTAWMTRESKVVASIETGTKEDSVDSLWWREDDFGMIGL